MKHMTMEGMAKDEDPCLSVVSLLLDLKANIDAIDNNGYTALSYAAEAGNSDLVTFLVSKGANIEHQTNRGLTPLFLAVEKLKLLTVRTLIQLGARLRVRCLYVLACSKNVNALKMLRSISPGCEDVVDYTGSSALHWAACDNNVEGMKMLLDNGLANVGARDDKGMTPLHLAARHGNLEAVDYLVQKGANIHAVDNHNKTPFQWAILWRRTKVAEYLDKTRELYF